MNHRRKLWAAQRARTVLEPLLDGIELVIAAQEDAPEVFGLDGAYLADGQAMHHEPAIPGVEVDPIGRWRVVVPNL